MYVYLLQVVLTAMWSAPTYTQVLLDQWAILGYSEYIIFANSSAVLHEQCCINYW